METWSFVLWMLITITILIAVKVVTGTFLNRKQKKLAAIRQELQAARGRLEHSTSAISLPRA